MDFSRESVTIKTRVDDTWECDCRNDFSTNNKHTLELETGEARENKMGEKQEKKYMSDIHLED